MRNLLNRIVLAVILVAGPLTGFVHAQPIRILFTNVNVWDGTSESLDMNTNVLVEGNMIASVGPAISLPEGAEVIDGGERTLMPGLIESHVHLNLQHMIGGYETMENRDWQEIGAMAAFASQSLLMDGFTTVRDMGTLQGGRDRHHGPDYERRRNLQEYAVTPGAISVARSSKRGTR